MNNQNVLMALAFVSVLILAMATDARAFVPPAHAVITRDALASADLKVALPDRELEFTNWARMEIALNNVRQDFGGTEPYEHFNDEQIFQGTDNLISWRESIIQEVRKPSSNKGDNKINCNKHKPTGGSSTNADIYNDSSKTISFRGNNWGAAPSNNPYSINAIVNSGSSSNTDVRDPISDRFGTSNSCTAR